MNNSVVFLLDNPYHPDNRVENEILALAEAGYKVDLYCVSSPKLPDYEDHGSYRVYRKISPELHRPFSKQFRQFVSEFVENIVQAEFDILHCHDFRMLIIGAKVLGRRPNVRLVYDSHEYLLGYPYFLRSGSWSSKLKGALVWLWYVLQETRGMKKAHHLITVSDSLAGFLEKRSSRPCSVVRNVPPVVNLCQENCHYWHDKFQLPHEIRIMIHTGNAHFSNKRLIQLLELVQHHRDLALIFLGSNPSVENIQRLVLNKEYERVYFHEQIPRKHITYYCSQADYGLVYTWNKQWRSYWYALPNKLMDVSCAAIPVLATNQPEIKRFIDQYGHGVTFDGDSETSMEEAMNALFRHDDTLRQHARSIPEKVSWSAEKQKLLGIYQKILSA